MDFLWFLGRKKHPLPPLSPSFTLFNTNTIVHPLHLKFNPLQGWGWGYIRKLVTLNVLRICRLSNLNITTTFFSKNYTWHFELYESSTHLYKQRWMLGLDNQGHQNKIVPEKVETKDKLMSTEDNIWVFKLTT